MRSIIATACALVALAFSGAVAADPIQLRVMSFNIWYGGEQVSFPTVAEAIRRADADIVGVQEPDGNLARLAEAAGYPFYDTRRNIISRYPIFDPGIGERTDTGPTSYSTLGLNEDALAAWVMVAPGRVIAVANTHLTSDPYGPEAVRDGADLDAVMALENRTRVVEARALAPLAQLARAGTPVFLTGDFNTPAPGDWSAAARRGRTEIIRYPVAWPAIGLLLQAGLRDTYRDAHPDPTVHRGFTYTPGQPAPFVRPRETIDRIDYVFAAGPSQTLASQIVGEPGGPDVDIAVAPWPSDHRAVVSTFRVDPIEAPALISVTPRRVIQGETFLVRGYEPGGELWSARIVARGADPTTARLAVVNEIGPWRRAARLSSAELAPGDYDAVLIGRDGGELKRTRFTVVTTEDEPSVAAIIGVVRAGDAIRVRWANAPGNRFDWIGVFRADDPGLGDYVAYAYTQAHFSGETQIMPAEPLTPGAYELRLMLDDSPTVLARAPLVVRAR